MDRHAHAPQMNLGHTHRQNKSTVKPYKSRTRHITVDDLSGPGPHPPVTRCPQDKKPRRVARAGPRAQFQILHFILYRIQLCKYGKLYLSIVGSLTVTMIDAGEAMRAMASNAALHTHCIAKLQSAVPYQHSPRKEYMS